mmetsp:Transcript_68009/g.186400  ORF Transcript_68009/g.186400 Transcript_68009/m.186400 type:complete len:269 (-) Transcript_68009:353-1159(-)
MKERKIALRLGVNGDHENWPSVVAAPCPTLGARQEAERVALGPAGHREAWPQCDGCATFFVEGPRDIQRQPKVALVRCSRRSMLHKELAGGTSSHGCPVLRHDDVLLGSVALKVLVIHEHGLPQRRRARRYGRAQIAGQQVHGVKRVDRLVLADHERNGEQVAAALRRDGHLEVVEAPVGADADLPSIDHTVARLHVLDDDGWRRVLVMECETRHRRRLRPEDECVRVVLGYEPRHHHHRALRPLKALTHRYPVAKVAVVSGIAQHFP